MSKTPPLEDPGRGGRGSVLEGFWDFESRDLTQTTAEIPRSFPTSKASSADFDVEILFAPNGEKGILGPGYQPSPLH